MIEMKPPKQNILILKLKFHTEYALFIVLNMLDVFLTMLIIGRGGVEVNPLARWFLMHTGKAGFLIYKIVLMLFVIALCELVARKRKRVARLLIWFGILALLGVVAISAIRYVNTMRGITAL